MSSSRFSTSGPRGGQPELSSLVLKCQQDPLDVILTDPTSDQLETALSHVGVSLHNAALDMTAEAISRDLPLDESVLSEVALTSNATIEERHTYSGTEVVREIIVRRLPFSDEGEEVDREVDEHGMIFVDERSLELRLAINSDDKLEASLSWENYDCSDSLNTLLDRWKRIDELFHALGKPELPWDISPFLKATSPDEGDDRYAFNGVTLCAYPADPEVILDYTDQKQWADPNDSSFDNDEEEKDEEYYTNSSEDDDSFEDQQSSDQDVSHRQPGDEIVIINPTARQLAKIANLSSAPMTKEVFEAVLSAIHQKRPFNAKSLANVSQDVLSKMSVHVRHTYHLEQGLTDSVSVHVDETDMAKPILFSVSLSNQESTIFGESDRIQAVLNWEQFSATATVKNWGKIVETSQSND